MDEKLMGDINIAGENVPDTLKDKVKRKTYCCRGNQLLPWGDREEGWGRDSCLELLGAIARLGGSRILGDAAVL